MTKQLPPWMDRECEHCGREHHPQDDCLPDHVPPEASKVIPFEQEPQRYQTPAEDIIADLCELFGEPIEIAPGFFAFFPEKPSE